MQETLSESNIWNSIEGYPLYEVSYNGEVRKIGGKVLKQSKTSRGYLCVRLSNENGTRTHNVHKLVAQAFIMRNKGTFEVNHKDGNKTNNRVNNLEWVTHRENILHREYVLKKNAWGKPARPVFCLETGEEYPSINLAARQVGVSPNTMLQSCKNGGKIKGLTWNFIKN